MKLILIMICLGYAMANMSANLERLQHFENIIASEDSTAQEIVAAKEEADKLAKDVFRGLKQKSDQMIKRMSSPVYAFLERTPYSTKRICNNSKHADKYYGCFEDFCYDALGKENCKNYLGKCVSEVNIINGCRKSCGLCKSSNPVARCKANHDKKKKNHGCCIVGGMPSNEDHSNCGACKDLKPHTCSQYMVKGCKADNPYIGVFLENECPLTCGLCKAGDPHPNTEKFTKKVKPNEDAT